MTFDGEFLTGPVDAASVRTMFARERPGLEVRSVRLLGGGRDVRLQALDAEGRLYDRRRWQSPWLAIPHWYFWTSQQQAWTRRRGWQPGKLFAT